MMIIQGHTLKRKINSICTPEVKNKDKKQKEKWKTKIYITLNEKAERMHNCMQAD